MYREPCPYSTYKKNTKRFGQRELEEILNDLVNLYKLPVRSQKERLIEIRCFVETECFDIFCGLGEIDPSCMKSCIISIIDDCVEIYDFKDLHKTLRLINVS